MKSQTPYLSLRQRLHPGVLYIYRLCIEPKSQNEDERRNEFVLNILLIGIILVTSILGVELAYHIVTQGALYRGVPIVPFLTLDAIYVGILALSRKGFVRRASIAFIALFLSAVTFASFRFGADISHVVLSNLLVILMSGILLGSRGGFYTTVIVCALTIGIWNTQIPHFLSEQWLLDHKSQASDGKTLAIMYFIVFVVSWLANRELYKSLIRARNSEHALAQERDWLEIKVEERTRELKTSQTQKMNELYRFIEFGKLSSGFFHDLINPLTSLALSIEEAERSSPKTTSKVRDSLTAAVRASKRIEYFMHIIRKQLQAEERSHIFEPDREIQEAVDILHFKSRSKKVDLRFAVLGERSKLHGNPLKLHQVALNLISNAIDAYEGMPKETARTVEISLVFQKSATILTVIDHGSGIKQELQEKIFEPFFTTKDPRHGVGLGLSTTKEIVEKDFKGTISVVSTQNTGTLFTVHLPFTSPAGIPSPYIHETHTKITETP